MNLLHRIYRPLPCRQTTNKPVRYFHLGRILPELDESISQQIEDGVQVKTLPSMRRIGFVQIPAQLEFAAQAKIAQMSKIANPKFRREAMLMTYVTSRFKLPDDEHTIKLKKGDIKTTLELRDKIPDNHEDDLIEDQKIQQFELQKLIEGTLEDRRRDWHYFEYDDYASSLYMAARLPRNYVALKTIMEEIRTSDPTFMPESVLDFGSGMGTTIWAVNETWPAASKEFMNIDISKEQQFLCEFLLRGGKESGPPLRGVFHRQYLPSSGKKSYDMVVSAFSMLELPTAESRMQVIENLWQQTDDILVLVEFGNEGGFKIINDARHFILDLTGHDVTRKIRSSTAIEPSLKLSTPQSHVVAPCPHEFECPRAMMGDKKRMNVCRFKVSYQPLEVWRKAAIRYEEFSYVVIRKKPHPTYLSSCYKARWPRVVEPTHKSHHLTTLKLCCPSGHLAEATITRGKHGKIMHDVAKACSWGDLVPIKIKDEYSRKSSFIDKKTVSVDCDNKRQDSSAGEQ